MSIAEDNRELLKKIMEVSARDKDELRSYFSPEARFYEPESLPYGGEYYGEDRFKEFREVFAATWSEMSFEMRDILTSDTRAATFGFFTVTSRATGKSTTFPLCEVWEFEDGKIIRVDAIYGDTAKVLEALTPDDGAGG